MRVVRFACLIVACALAGRAHAEVVETSTNGFRLKTDLEVAASPPAVFKAVGQIGQWWNGDHTYSGKASNMTLPLSANACFCEALPGGGSVRHGVVVMVMPDRLVRLDAPLGPLQAEAVSAVLTFEMKPNASGTTLTVTFNVGGAREARAAKPEGIDAVITEAATRLKAYAETGKPQ